jgi:AcrR family transcriptional regulator
MKKMAPRNAVAAAENPTRDRIIVAAFKVFMEKGYAGASTLEIATRAKVSKRDLYANFASKAAILLACITNRGARMRLPADLPEPRRPEILAAALTTFGATLVREVCQPAVVGMFRLAISEAERSPDVAKILNTDRSRNRNALAGLLGQAQATGILGEGDPQEMMEQFFALVWGDLMLGRLLGAEPVPKPAEISRRAQAATSAFLKLHAKPTADGR